VRRAELYGRLARRTVLGEGKGGRGPHQRGADSGDGSGELGQEGCGVAMATGQRWSLVVMGMVLPLETTTAVAVKTST
jgi:hypothetical protein